MHKHDVRILVMLDGREVFFAALTAEIDRCGVMTTATEYVDVNGATRDMLLVAASELITEAHHPAARYPHASRDNSGNSGTSGAGDENDTVLQLPKP